MLHCEDEHILMLGEKDFPANYVDFIHPDDYKILAEPTFEKIFHRRKFHNRLLIRISFKVDDRYIPITFIIDTGFPMFFYLCPKAKEIFETRIEMDEFQTEFIKLPDGKRFTVDETPHIHHNVNIIGLMALNYFGFSLIDGEFEFERLPEYF